MVCLISISLQWSGLYISAESCPRHRQQKPGVLRTPGLNGA
jgi:hypothetical protein